MPKQTSPEPPEGANSLPVMLNTRDMMRILRLSRPVLMQLVAAGEIHASRINGRGDWRYLPTEPERYMAACQVRQPA
jgi:helix-turn-helix protein